MRLYDMTRPAVGWEEAAMLPACVHTLSGGAALKTLRETEISMEKSLEEKLASARMEVDDKEKKPVPAADAVINRSALLRRAAYRQLQRGERFSVIG